MLTPKPPTLYNSYPVKLADPLHPIESIPEMCFHLANAAAVELSTVPLYLYAAYSIQTSGYRQWNPGISAFRTIRSVVIEEMLHLCLARNVLTAIGGDMALYNLDVVTTYPSDMTHRWPPLELRLAPASPKLMEDVFIPLELPSRADIMLAAAEEKFIPIEYRTLGEFYDAILAGLQHLETKFGVPALWGDEQTKDKRAALQYGRAYWNDDGGGEPIIVSDLASATTAIKTIVDQGEGAASDKVPLKPAHPTPGLDELTHYAKFQRIADGIDMIGDVWPVPTNPKRTDYTGSLLALATLFDAAYCYVLCMIDEIYRTPTITRDRDANGHIIAKTPVQSHRYLLERTFLAAMGGVLYPIADLLVRTPLDPKVESGPHAGPTFGYYAFVGEKKDELVKLCEAAVADFPSLGGDDGVLQLIQRLPPVGVSPVMH